RSSTDSAARTGKPCHSATASSSVLRARGCRGSGSSCALRNVSLGPLIATTRVPLALGAIPIQIDSLSRLLARRLGRLRDGGVLRAGDDRGRANFLATRVRFDFSLALSPSARTSRCLLPCRALPPVRLLRSAAARCALGIVHLPRAVDLTAIAAAAEMEDSPAVIQNTLNLPQIVHSRPRPQRTRPPAGTRATTPASNASTRGDSGLGGDDSGPHCFGAVDAIVRPRRPVGQLLRQTGLLKFPRFSVAADTRCIHATFRAEPRRREHVVRVLAERL